MPYLYVTVLLCLLDQAVKWLVQRAMAPFESIEWLSNIVSITYVRNYGAAFGILQSQTFLLTAVAGSVVWLIWHNRRRLQNYSKLSRLGLAIALGGVVGNGIDRLRLGYVVDYIDLHIWPVFNIADINIVLGVFLLGVGIWLEDRRQPSPVGHVADQHPTAGSPLEDEQQ